ncbi:4-hydroxy-tetrahydrodipicolinate reductase [Sporanaerobium hydrogeniformans]|uniref:4-hydroxy-tetrahydrodipicolinate reductase n=1 Tax=Sporanaerobium hydrogeniformans TaxID=3072179 RepID=A0AC61DE93_9FIRM|nr:4-hydroxy-tetrahydrodipicolinate reductase [Sporanaerobium hydrogeniformans]PHV70892.1 4-hydroxy-tetrahydrodipicolinate reductase [Sporanaerobium hydrogeniformans]
MIKVLMHGCNGKIGQTISRIIKNQQDMELVAGVDPYLHIVNPFPVFATIDECPTPADVIIDFSTASAVPALLEYARQKKMPLVVCTTGLSDEVIEDLKNSSHEIPIFFSANMSLGVNLLIALAKRATEILADSGFDIEIIEKHHNQKIDAPSGTALAIADAINETLDNSYTYRYDRSTVREKRPHKEIGIHAVRGGSIVGEHDVLFAGNDEFITLSHQATSKEVFAVGALKAARFLVTKTPGLYNMDHLLQA